MKSFLSPTKFGLYFSVLVGFCVCFMFVCLYYLDTISQGNAFLERNSFVCHDVQNVSKSGKRGEHWECNDPDEHEPSEPYTYVYAPSVEHPKFSRMMEDQERLQEMMCKGQKSMNAIIFTCEGPSCPGASPHGMEGLLLSYLLAVLTKRAFLVNTPNWMKLDDYLYPVLKTDKNKWRESGVDWRISKCKGALKRAEELKKVLYSPVDLRLPHGVGCPLAKRLLSEEVSLIAVMAEDKQQRCGYEVLKAANVDMPKWRFEPIYSLIFRKRFKFSKEIRQGAETFMSDHKVELNHKTICFNVETRTLLGRSPGAMHRNIEDFWRCGRWLERGAKAASEMHSADFVRVPSNLSEYTWLVTADRDDVSDSSLRWLQRRGFYRRVVSTVSAGFTRPSHSLHVQLKHTFIELLILSRCHRYVGSNSAQSMMAASLYPKFETKIFVQVRTEALRHGLPLQDICIRERGGWGADLYD